uniref:Uncharacterized protein n=1 Tax=Triticum urartu TaxID=4572 RepID=A0A8R7UMJ5_TRIUA
MKMKISTLHSVASETQTTYRICAPTQQQRHLKTTICKDIVFITTDKQECRSTISHTLVLQTSLYP